MPAADVNRDAGSPSLTLENVSVQVAGNWLLQDVGLTVRPGELLAVIGPNGAGKSTLLRVLCGDLVPERGTVTLDGRPLRHWSRAAQAKRRAVLPQESSLSFPFLAFEVALMGRSPHVRGAESEKDKAMTLEALRETQAAEYAERLYPTLSGGEKGRVQLARALAQIWEPQGEARYLFLDEPTNNLDLEHQHRALGSARDFAEAGVGVLAVLHDLNLAAQYADRILLLNGGRVAASGKPEAVLSAERLGRVFNIEVAVLRHPLSGRPLVVSSGAAQSRPRQQKENHHV